jgi:hypothetical protein
VQIQRKAAARNSKSAYVGRVASRTESAVNRMISLSQKLVPATVGGRPTSGGTGAEKPGAAMRKKGPSSIMSETGADGMAETPGKWQETRVSTGTISGRVESDAHR